MNAQATKNAIVYNPDAFCSGRPPVNFMLSFVRSLQQRYQALIDAAAPSDKARADSLSSLLISLEFAEGVLEKAEWFAAHPQHPLHVAIVGPTQAGKSSVINWLAGTTLAEASPLAGFTVHPQGFALTASSAELDGLDAFFHGYQRVSREALDHQQLNAYSLEPAPSNSGTLSNTVLWDTPDFDSVQSGEYRNGVLRIAALADVVILVVSKDKYADLSVWEFMRLLGPLAQPTLIILNKTDPHPGVTLLASLEDKWRSFRSDPVPPIVPIPYLSDSSGMSTLAEQHHQALTSLQAALAKVRRAEYPQAAQRLLRSHWPQWTAPIVLEHRLIGEWQERLDHVVLECMERYQRNYLDHPNHYATFQRALAELLTLLEIPGIGNALLQARRLVTWPVRQLGKLGKMAAGQEQGLDGGESAILHQLAEHALVRIGEELLLNSSNDPLEQRWWTSINQQVVRQRERVMTQFDAATQAYIRGFQPEIEKTAHGLYDHLQDHPLVLNSLRATRVTTDAAALAVALHTGGIGVQDFVIAPAMLSVTSLLTESALGRYMNKSAEHLKTQQKKAVTQLFAIAIREPLANLPEQLDSSGLVGITADTLNQASLELR